MASPDNPLYDVYTLPKPFVEKRKIYAYTRRNAILIYALALFVTMQDFGRAVHGAYFWRAPEWGAFYSAPQAFDWASLLLNMHGAWHDVVVAREERVLAIAFAIASAAIYLLHRHRSITAKPTPDVQGSARFARHGDIVRTNNRARDTGLYHWRGPYLCAVEEPRGPLAIGKRQRFLRSDPETHTMVVAPTGTGKTTAYVIPSALTWKWSMFQFDPKGEIYERTAWMREQMGQRVLPLDLMDQTGQGARLNPLDFLDLDSPTIIKDIGVITTILSDPDGTGPGRGLTATEQHFLSIGQSVAQAGIAYAKLLEEVDARGNVIPETRATLTRVGDLFIGGEDATGDLPSSTQQLLHDIANWRPNPKKRYRWKSERLMDFVRKAITDIILMTEQERSGVINTFKRFFAPYREFAVAQATSETTFVDRDGNRVLWDPKDLVTADATRYISLYLIIAPRDRTFLRPVVRMILNVLIGFLMDAKSHEAAAREPLWMCIDEFDTLGRLNIVEDNINIFRSFKVVLSLIIQGFSQLHNTYGRDEKITMACRNLVVYTPAPGDSDTRTKVSDLLGNMHLRYLVPASTDKGQPHVTEHARRLMTPDEVGRLPRERAIVFTDSCDRPIYGWKHPWFSVAAFVERVKPPRVSLEPIIAERDRQPFESQPVDQAGASAASAGYRRAARVAQAVAQARGADSSTPAATSSARPSHAHGRHLLTPTSMLDDALGVPDVPNDIAIEPPDLGRPAWSSR